MEKFFSSFIERLTIKLKEPLPGEKAHRIMEAWSAAYLTINPNKQTQKSAVLVLFYPFKGEIYLPLILRNSYDGFIPAKSHFRAAGTNRQTET